MDHAHIALRLPCEMRPAVVADAPEIAAVHVQCWNETYAGLLPPRMMRAGIAERTASWRRILADDRSAATLIALLGGQAVGFASLGSQRDSALARLGYRGEIRALYVLAHAQRRGIGGWLMRGAAHRMLDAGIGSVALWCLSANQPARSFYEHLGGVPLGQRRFSGDPESMGETAYGWRSLETLL